MDRNDLKPQFIENEKVEEFFGAGICEEYEPDVHVTFNDDTTYLISNNEKIKAIRFNEKTARAICVDKFGNGVVYINFYGKGKVYFCAFKDYFNKSWGIKVVKHLLENIGKKGDAVCDNKNVSFTMNKAMANFRLQCLI